MVINCSSMLWDFGFYQVNLFGFVIAISFLVMLSVMFSEKKSKFFGRWFLYEIMLETSALGFIGARILFALEHYLTTGQVFSFFDLMAISEGGGSVTGALLFALPYLFFRTINAGFYVLELADFLAPKISLFYALSRIGCLLVGCCHGFAMKTPLWFSVVYLQSPFATNNVAYFPAQALVAIASFCSFLFLNYFLSYRVAKIGIIAASFFVIEGFMRFLMEFMRPDVIYVFIGLTLVQCICLLIIFFGVLIMLYANKKFI